MSDGHTEPEPEPEAPPTQFIPTPGFLAFVSRQLSGGYHGAMGKWTPWGRV